MRNILAVNARENKSTQNTPSNAAQHPGLPAKHAYRRILQISSPADNPMPELNHARID